MTPHPHQETAEPIGPEFDWDGHSPINGEEVTQSVEFAGQILVFTASSVYRARPRDSHAADHAQRPASGL